MFSRSRRKKPWRCSGSGSGTGAAAPAPVTKSSCQVRAIAGALKRKRPPRGAAASNACLSFELVAVDDADPLEVHVAVAVREARPVGRAALAGELDLAEDPDLVPDARALAGLVARELERERVSRGVGGGVGRALHL